MTSLQDFPILAMITGPAGTFDPRVLERYDGRDLLYELDLFYRYNPQQADGSLHQLHTALGDAQAAKLAEENCNRKQDVKYREVMNDQRSRAQQGGNDWPKIKLEDEDEAEVLNDNEIDDVGEGKADDEGEDSKENILFSGLSAANAPQPALPVSKSKDFTRVSRYHKYMTYVTGNKIGLHWNPEDTMVEKRPRIVVGDYDPSQGNDPSVQRVPIFMYFLLPNGAAKPTYHYALAPTGNPGLPRKSLLNWQNTIEPHIQFNNAYVGSVVGRMRRPDLSDSLAMRYRIDYYVQVELPEAAWYYH